METPKNILRDVSLILMLIVLFWINQIQIEFPLIPLLHPKVELKKIQNCRRIPL